MRGDTSTKALIAAIRQEFEKCQRKWDAEEPAALETLERLFSGVIVAASATHEKRRISSEQIAKWRKEQGQGMESAIGEYTPPEFWEVLDELERLYAAAPSGGPERDKLVSLIADYGAEVRATTLGEVDHDLSTLTEAAADEVRSLYAGAAPSWKVTCPACMGGGELREAVQAWDVPGAPVPDCPHCKKGILDLAVLLAEREGREALKWLGQIVQRHFDIEDGKNNDYGDLIDRAYAWLKPYLAAAPREQEEGEPWCMSPVEWDARTPEPPAPAENEALRVLAAFARTAPGRLPHKVQQAVNRVQWESPTTVLNPEGADHAD